MSGKSCALGFSKQNQAESRSSAGVFWNEGPIRSCAGCGGLGGCLGAAGGRARWRHRSTGRGARAARSRQHPERQLGLPGDGVFGLDAEGPVRPRPAGLPTLVREAQCPAQAPGRHGVPHFPPSLHRDPLPDRESRPGHSLAHPGLEPRAAGVLPTRRRPPVADLPVIALSETPLAKLCPRAGRRAADTRKVPPRCHDRSPAGAR